MGHIVGVIDVGRNDGGIGRFHSLMGPPASQYGREMSQEKWAEGEKVRSHSPEESPFVMGFFLLPEDSASPEAVG